MRQKMYGKGGFVRRTCYFCKKIIKCEDTKKGWVAWCKHRNACYAANTGANVYKAMRQV